MYDGQVKTATEGDVTYTIETAGDEVRLSVVNNVTKKELHYTYYCQYQPIFGYDCLDVANINNKLDELMVEAAR